MASPSPPPQVDRIRAKASDARRMAIENAQWEFKYFMKYETARILADQNNALDMDAVLGAVRTFQNRCKKAELAHKEEIVREFKESQNKPATLKEDIYLAQKERDERLRQVSEDHDSEVEQIRQSITGPNAEVNFNVKKQLVYQATRAMNARVAAIHQEYAQKYAEQERGVLKAYVPPPFELYGRPDGPNGPYRKLKLGDAGYEMEPVGGWKPTEF